MTSVLLVDDHAVVREGYRRLLERTSDLKVTAEAASGEDAYRVYWETPADVVVMDVSLPGMSGIETTRRILARQPAAKVLVFSMHEDTMFASRALQAGAKGYVTKSSAPEVLVDAVRAVAAGKMYITQDVAQQLALQSLPGQRLPLNALSPREFEVFRLLAQGHPVQDIANKLCLSQKTIANYQSSIRQKLEVTSAAQIVRLAISCGLVDSGTPPPELDDGAESLPGGS
ncbi:MAG: response regulator [Burkholderiales bacterium]